MSLIVFLYGIIIGSFLNVCIWRIPRGESILFPPSHCPNCSSRLKFYDLFPLLSFVSTGGRCRYCSDKISLQYPLIELINGGLYLLLFYEYGRSFAFIMYCLLASLLLVIGMVDYHTQMIPNEFILMGFGIVLLFNTHTYINQPSLFATGLWGLLLGGGFFLILAIITDGGMGGGDIKLMGLVGFLLGWKSILLVMLLSFVLGGLISIMLISLKIKARKDFIPFGPFIGIATLLTVLYGRDIINIYIGFFVK